ncbi:PEGA domain-containing protein [Methanoregula sp.]|uniref:PEGA domain-containing protein n=1 Tax=Methanoregula sp. TaxID=2052170 RepID=UPI0035671002
MIRKTILILVIFFVLLSGCTTPEKVPEKGTLQFTSSPSGAQVYLDDQFRGSTPSTVTGIEPGNHNLEFRYPGYDSWSTVMAVSPGPNNVFAALLPTSVITTPIPVVLITASPAKTPASVTIQASRESMVTGDSIQFSGTATGCNQVLLTIYGPGSYTNGVSLTQQNVNSGGSWSYTWNPGKSIMAGTYTMVVSDPYKTASAKAQFSVIGGGLVSISPSSYAVSQGSTIGFSGLCTTGSQNVQLVLYGPGQYSGGVVLGTFSVQANKNWNFQYATDLTTPTGYYTIYVYDVPKTTSSSVQFSVGFA